MSTKPKRGVSLSGKTRLTVREAAALLELAGEGLSGYEVNSTDPTFGRRIGPGERAIDKLMIALDEAGCYLDDGTFIDPFDSEPTKRPTT